MARYQVSLTGPKSAALYGRVNGNSMTDATNAATQQWHKDHESRGRGRWSEGAVTRTDGQTDPDGKRSWSLRSDSD